MQAESYSPGSSDKRKGANGWKKYAFFGPLIFISEFG